MASGVGWDYAGMTGPHLFVVRGDLTHLHCDAWLLPGDQRYSVKDDWYEAVQGLRGGVQVLKGTTPGFASGAEVAVAVGGWPTGEPLPVLTAVPLYGVEDPVDVRAAVAAFVRVAAAAVRTRSRVTSRPLPLLALPAFATRAGGGGDQRGAVLRELIAAAREAAIEAQVDVALVLRSGSDLALTQAQRRRPGVSDQWPALNDALRGQAEHLAGLAARGRLVPFMGSGIGVSAGLPTWPELIDRLAASVGLDVTQMAQLRKLDVLDQGHVLHDLFLERKRDFGEAVVAEVDKDRYGLAPALLASLPITQAVTLNYDRLFEVASADAGQTLAVLPEASARDARRWLLKLHGTVTDSRSIVLTRDDYLGYSASREALSAIVKALLITHHLLFVGFGLTDDHFHAIVHDVRRALPADQMRDGAFGTALVLSSDDLQRRIWHGSVDLLPMEAGHSLDGDQEPGKSSLEDRARTLEIFLDCLLAHASDSHSYLLADGYDAELSEGERSLRSKLIEFTRRATESERTTSAWQVVAQALRELGWPDRPGAGSHNP